MSSKIECANSSSLELTPTGISIWLPIQVFGALWSLLANQISAIANHSPIIPFNQRKMTLRGAEASAPRWIANQIDVLSWFIFLLKVPTKHELVRLWQVIDWTQINRLAAPYYHNAHGGRPAWAPAQLVAILILMFLHGIPYETTVVRLIGENIVWCWFSGFGLFGPFPTHDALYEFRKRVGAECFQEILTLVVQACMAAGLVDNELIHFDLTPCEASAHRWSPYERAVIVSQALIRYLELVWAEQTPEESFPESLKVLAAQVALETLPHKALKSIKAERIVESVETWHQKAGDSNPIWQQASEQLAQQLAQQAPTLPRAQKDETNANANTNTNANANTNVNADAQANANADAEAEANANTNANIDTNTNTNTDIDINTNINTNIDTSTNINTDIDTKTNANANVDTNADVDRNANTNADVDRNANINTDVDRNANGDTNVNVFVCANGSAATIPAPSRTTIGLIPPASIEIIEVNNSPQIMLNDEAGVDQITKEMIHTHLSDLAKKVIKGLPHTRGDSDARVGRTTNYTWFCGYLIGFVVDDAHQVITAVVLGAGNAKQAHLFCPAIKAHIDRVGTPEAVAADSAFDEYQTHVFLDNEQIVGNVTSRNHSKPKDGGYGTDRVTWKDGIPSCPVGKPLEAIGKPKKNGQQRYQGTKCCGCKEYSRCYPSGDGKPKNFAIKPTEHQRWQENRQANQSQEYKEAQRSRFATEGRFGLAKNNHHADRAPYRSDDYNLIAALMIATMMNFRILAKHQ